MRTIPAFLIVVLLLPVSVLAEEEPKATRSEFYAEYVVEDLKKDPGIVSGSGVIRIVYDDFELSVPDGGVVLWVDPGAWKKFRSGAAKPAEGEDAAAAGRDAAAAIQEILGPVIRELYAEGNVTLRRGAQVVRADRLYYNFGLERAVILDAEAVAQYEDRRTGLKIPISVRADSIRQVARNRLEAGPARLTSCLFADPHWEVTIDEIVIGREPEGFWATSRGNVLRLWDQPVFWFPWLHIGPDFGLEPLRGVDVGRSSRFGYFAEVSVGTAIRVGEGENERNWGEWVLTPHYRTRRGPGATFELPYGDVDYRGELIGVYQRDRADEDHVTDLPFGRRDRGRGLWRHHHVFDRDVLGGRLLGIAEISWLSDRGFLEEYYTSEERQGKAQEMVGYLDWAGGSHALSLTGKWRANEFQTQTEYRPRVGYDLFSLPVLHDLAGTGMNVHLSGEAEVAKVRRVFDDDLHRRGPLTDRLQARASVALPVSLGPVRLTPEFTAGYTDYGNGQHGDRWDFAGGVRAAVDFWRVYADTTSETFDLQGLRHVLSVSLGWTNRFAVTQPSRDHFVSDSADLLDELHTVDLRIRNRFQTKRDGAVVDWIDLEARALFFPEETAARPAPFDAREEWVLGVPSLLVPEEEKFRAIRRKGFGPILLDLRAKLRENLFLAADVWFDAETGQFETYSEALRYEAFPDLSVFLGHRAIRNDSSVITAWADFSITDRWGLRVFQQYDFRDTEGLAAGVTLRRFFHDFLVELTLRRNFDEGDSSFSVSVTPSLIYEARGRREAATAVQFDDMRWYR